MLFSKYHIIFIAFIYSEVFADLQHMVIIILLIFLIILGLSRLHGNPVRRITRRVVALTEGKMPINGDDRRDYYILANKPKKEEAAKLAEKVNDFMIRFIIALKRKYLYNEITCFSEPKFSPEDEFVPFQKSCAVDDPLSDFRLRAIYLLVTRYRPNYLEENQPTSSKDTSWEEGKGERIALCLREQKSGEYKFIDTELIKFVSIHELTHIAANTLEHPYYFWKVFKFLLLEANQLVGYELIDYKKYPTNYCEMEVTYNPAYDTGLNITKNEPTDITAI
jgi:hypothetical protein